MKLTYLFNNRNIDMEANQADGALRVTLPNGITRNIDIRSDSDTRDGDETISFDQCETGTAISRLYSLPVAHTERGTEISYQGRTYVFNEPRIKDGGLRGKRKGSADSGSLTAPMVGVLSELFVCEGDTVAAYQPLAIVEAMKVMATIESPFAGTVKRVYTKKGAQLKHGEAIIDVVPVVAK